MLQQRKKAANFTFTETESLIYNLELRPDLVLGNFDGEFKSFAEQRQAWEEIAEDLASVDDGPLRTAADVKRKWQDYKSRLKCKLEKLSRLKSVPGTVLPRPYELTALEERALALIDRAAISTKVISNTDADLQHVEDSPEKNISSASDCNLGDRSLPVTKCSTTKNIPQKVIIPSATEWNRIDRAPECSTSRCTPPDDDRVQISKPSVSKDPVATVKCDKNLLKTKYAHATTAEKPLRVILKRTLDAEEKCINSISKSKIISKEVKEIKEDLQKMRKCIEEIAKIKRMKFQLKCYKDGISIEEVEEKQLVVFPKF